MKREGRQHGMVRTYRILPSPLNPRPGPTRTINVLDSPPTCGIFTKVNPAKPTNHSKFSGKCGKAKCGECHLHPAGKSKENTKGMNKVRGHNGVGFDMRMVTWRVVDSGHGMGFGSGSSASRILAELDEEEDEVVGGVEMDGGDEIEVENGEEVNDVDYANNEDDDETMSFCEVGYVWEQVEGDESWCLVAEM